MGAQKEKLYKMLIIGFYMDDGTYKKVSHFEFHLPCFGGENQKKKKTLI
jgi:hypothetical protein